MPYVPGKGWVEDEDQPRFGLPGRSPVRLAPTSAPAPAAPAPSSAPVAPSYAPVNAPPSYRAPSSASEVTDWNALPRIADPLAVLDLPNAWLGERIDYLRSGDPIEPVLERTLYHNYEGTKPPTLTSRIVGEAVRGEARDVGLVDALFSPMHYSHMILGGAYDAGRELVHGDIMGAGREIIESGAEIADFARGYAAFTAELATDLALDPIMWTVPLTRVAKTGTRAVRGLLPRVARQPGKLIEEIGGVEARGVFEREFGTRMGAVLEDIGGEQMVYRGPEAAARVRAAIHESARKAIPNLGDEAATIVEAEAYQALNYFAGPHWRYGPVQLGRYRGVAARVGDDPVLRATSRALGGDVAGTRYLSRVDQMRRSLSRSVETPTGEQIAEYVAKFGREAGMADDSLEALMALEQKFWRSGTEGQIIGGSVMPGVGGSPVTAGLYENLGYLDDVGLGARQILSEEIALSPAAHWLQRAEETLARPARRVGQRIGEDLLAARTPIEQTMPHVEGVVRGLEMETARLAESVALKTAQTAGAHAALRTLQAAGMAEEVAQQGTITQQETPITGPAVDVTDDAAVAEAARARGDEAAASYYEREATGEVAAPAEGTITPEDVATWVREKGGAASLQQVLEAADEADSDLVVDALQQAKAQGLVQETARDVMGFTEFTYTTEAQPTASQAPVAAEAPLAPRIEAPEYEPSGREAFESEDARQLRLAQERGDQPAIVHYTRRVQEANTAQQAARRAPATPEVGATPTPTVETPPAGAEAQQTTPEQAPAPAAPTMTVEEALAANYPAPMNSDQLVSATGLPISQVSSSLMLLEVQGKVKSFPGNQFVRTVELEGEQQAAEAASPASGPAVVEAPAEAQEMAPAAPEASPEVAGGVEVPQAAPDAPAAAEAPVEAPQAPVADTTTAPDIEQRVEGNIPRVLDRLMELHGGGSRSYSETESGFAPDEITKAVLSAEALARGFRAASRDETSFAITDVLVPSDRLTQEAARMRWPAIRDAATQVDELHWIHQSQAGTIEQAAKTISMPEEYTEQLLLGPIAQDLGYRLLEGDTSTTDASRAKTTSIIRPTQEPNWPTAEQAAWQAGIDFDADVPTPDRGTLREGPGADTFDKVAQLRSIIATNAEWIAEEQERMAALTVAAQAMREEGPALAQHMRTASDTGQVQQRAQGTTDSLDRAGVRTRALTTYWPKWEGRHAHVMKTAWDSALSYKQRIRAWGDQLFGQFPRHQRVLVTQLMAMQDYKLREDLHIREGLTLPADLEVIYTDEDRFAAIYENLGVKYDDELLAQGYDALPERGKELYDAAQAGLDLLYTIYWGVTRDGEEIFAVRAIRDLWDNLNEWSGGAYLGESRGYVENYFPQPRVLTDIPEFLVAARGMLAAQGMDPEAMEVMLEEINQFKRKESIEYRRTFTKLGARMLAQAARIQEAGGQIDAEAALLLTQMDPLDAMNWYADQAARVSLRHDIIKFVNETFPTEEEITAELGPGAVQKMKAAGFRTLTIAAKSASGDLTTAVLPGTEGRLMPKEYAGVLEARLMGQSGTPEMLSTHLMSLARMGRSLWSSAQVAVLVTVSFVVANLFEYVFRPVFQGINPISPEWAKNTAAVNRIFSRAVLNGTKIVPNRPLQPVRTGLSAAVMGGAAYGLTSLIADPHTAAWVGGVAAAAPVAGALTSRVRQVLAQASERTATFFAKEAGISDEQLDQYIREMIEDVVVTSGFGAQSKERLTHILPNVPGRMEDLGYGTHSLAERLFRRDFSEESRRRAGEIGHQFDLTREELRDLTEALSLLFFGWDNLHRATAYITHRERGETRERARAIVRDHTAEYTPGAGSPPLNAATAVMWYSTYMVQTGAELARKSAQYPGVAAAFAEAWRKRHRYAGLNRESELWAGAHRSYKGPEWTSLPWNTLLLPEGVRPGPTITGLRGPGLLSVRLRVVPAEEAGSWAELPLHPAGWMTDKMIPGPRMLAEAEGRQSYDVLSKLPVVGRYHELREEIPGSPTEWTSPLAKLGRRQEVEDDELRAYIMPEATRAAALRLSNFDPATGQKLAKDDPRRIPTGQMARAWTQYQKTRACPLECQAGKVMWREDPQKAAQLEFEQMRLMYDLRLAGARLGLSFDVEYGKDILGNMTLAQLVEAEAESRYLQSIGERPLASPQLYRAEIKDRQSYNPTTGHYMGSGPRTRFEQLQSVPGAMLRGTDPLLPTDTEAAPQPQPQGAAR